MVLREPNRGKRSDPELVENLITPILQPVAEMDRMIASWLVLVDILGRKRGRVRVHELVNVHGGWRGRYRRIFLKRISVGSESGWVEVGSGVGGPC